MNAIPRMIVKEKVPTPQTSHDQGLSGSLGDVFSKQRQTVIELAVTKR